MTPETGHFLAKARRLLREAETILGAGLHEAAGRSAYLAAFHAAQGMISADSGKAAKTHRGVHAEFYRLATAGGQFDAELIAFLARSYGLKAIADYETGPDAEVPRHLAVEAVATATRFVARIGELLDETPPRR